MGKLVDESEVLLEAGLSGSVTDEEASLAMVALKRAEGAIIHHLRYDPSQQVRTEFYPQADFDSQGDREGVWEVDSSQAYLRRESRGATQELQLQHVPVRASDADGNNAIDLRIDYDGRFGARSGSFDTDTQQTEGTDFWPQYDGVDSNGYAICRDGILRSVGLWPLEPGSVKVIYVGGYTKAEIAGQSALVDASPIGDAVVAEASRRLQRALIMKKRSGVGFIAGILQSEKLGDYSYSVDTAASTRLFGSLYDIMPETKEKLHKFALYALDY